MSHDESRDQDTVEDLIATCCDIIAFTKGVSREQLESDRKTVHAVSFGVAVLGEAAKRLSDQFRRRHGAIPWRKIAGMRDRIIPRPDYPWIRRHRH